MKNITTLKKGDTLAFIATLTDQENKPIIGIADNLKADVKTINDLKIAEFVITENDTIGGNYLFEIMDTTKFPVDILYTDIQYSNNGIVTSSETMTIQVTKDVTV